MYAVIFTQSCNLCSCSATNEVKNMTKEEFIALSLAPIVECECGYIREHSVLPCTFRNWRAWKEEVQSNADWNKEYSARPNLSEYSVKAAILEAEYWENLSLQLEDQTPIPDGMLHLSEMRKANNYIISVKKDQLLDQLWKESNGNVDI